MRVRPKRPVRLFHCIGGERSAMREVNDSIRRLLAAILLVFPALSVQGGSAAAGELSRCELKVTLDPRSHSISGAGEIVVSDRDGGYLYPGSLEILSLKIGEKIFQDQERVRRSLIRVGSGQVVEFRYQGKFDAAEERQNIENVGVTGQNVLGTEGIMLLSGWYPAFSGLCVYDLEVTLPENLVALSESSAIAHVSSPAEGMKTVKFASPIPVPGITLVAGVYTVREQVYRGVKVRTLFFPRHDHLSDTYMDSMKRYVDLYDSMLGPYPFKTFSIVENVFQTGYSFPTYTLLGSMIIPASYVPEISLGHEFLHQWFGHFVDVDISQGNWSEGLTTYLADHWYKELAGKGHEYRKKALIDFMQYVSPVEDVPVSQFKSRLDFATKAIGYGKTAMIFHMARKMAGDEAFFAGLRKFIAEHGLRTAGWNELRDSFNEYGEGNFEKFFDIWTTEKGMAELVFKPPVVRARGEKFVLFMDIVQKNGPFIFSLPLKVETEGTTGKFQIKVDGEKTRIEKTFDARPVRVVVDEDYDTFRRLNHEEVPPVISRFTGDKNNVVVISDSEREMLKDVVRFFENQGYRIADEDALRGDRVSESSILYLSSNRGALEKTLGGLHDAGEFPEGGSVVKVVKNKGNGNEVVVMFYFDDPDQLRSSYRKIFRYGNYSLLVFEDGENILKETAPAVRGVVLEIQ